MARQITIAAAFVIGLVIRWLARGYLTEDTLHYLLPWYEYAREHGLSALGQSFTNYTPLYTYALLGLTRLHGVAAPLTLVKSISLPFEFGCAALAYAIVLTSGGSRNRATAAFAFCWVAPTVLNNGAFWGQCDAMWGFFTLLAVWLYLRGSNGVPAFAAAFATKFQAAFLGPFVLGMALRRRHGWLWLAVVPFVYVALAVPVLFAGRPIGEVLSVYLRQAQTFHRLTSGAANIWILLPVPYTAGVAAGLAITVFAGLALAVGVARLQSPTPETLLKYACASLLIIPLLLPKMHERYFYGFELAVIPLACLNLRYLPYAAAAQVSGLLAYLAWSVTRNTLPLGPAAFLNIAMAAFLAADLQRPAATGSTFTLRAWTLFLAPASVLLLGLAPLQHHRWLLALLATLACAGFVDLVRWTVWPSRSACARATDQPIATSELQPD